MHSKAFSNLGAFPKIFAWIYHQLDWKSNNTNLIDGYSFQNVILSSITYKMYLNTGR